MLASSTEIDKDDPMTFAVPMAILFIFFFVITTSSGFMLTSVTKEKENRTAETLLVSLKPSQMMLGKILGLGIIALLQMSIWLGGALLALDNSSQLFATVTKFELPTGFIFWAILFFLFGYLMYASILGTIGVLSPNTREGGQFTFVAILPLLIPLWLNYTFTDAPNSPVAVFLSLFPLTAPSAMISRLTSGHVPTYQILLSLGGLIISSYFLIILASKLFRADNILSTESFRWRKIFAEFRVRDLKNGK
jgi:ABC-2 type transport system permease protein